MKKLFQINVTANWGSTGKIAESIGTVAMNQGWESYIAYGRYNNPSCSHMVKIGSQLDVYFHFAEQWICNNEGLASRSATKKLIAQIKEINPDVLQLHNIHDHYLNYQILFDYLNSTNIQVVWTFHDCWAFTGYCFHFVTKKCNKWKTECCDCPYKSKFSKILFDRSKKNYELKKNLFTGCKNLTIVPCSEWMANFVTESFLKEKRMEVIHNGVDLNVFKPVGKKKLNDKYHVLAVSNVWNKDKGLFDIYQLRKDLPLEYDITIVGLSDGQIKELPVGIVGIQRTQNVQELVELYSSANVLINPTYADTFPTVNLEALACGTPVITYNTGGSPEAIDEKTGVVVPQGDILALKEAIEMMRLHPLSSDDCRKRAAENFDKKKCFNKYIELYKSLLD